MKKVSLKDVAAKAGVSTTLVSYVLNGKQSNRINSETAEKIKSAAKALHYSPNYLARSLKSNRTFLLGLILADISNPFFSRLARIISDEAEALGYSLLIGSSDESIYKFERLASQFFSRQVDGLIIAPPAGSAAMLELLLDSSTPFVLVDRYFPGVGADSVCVDNFGAASKAAAYFLREARLKMAIITYDSGLQHIEDRVQGAIVTWEQYRPMHSFTAVVYRLHESDLESEMQRIMDHALADDADAFFFTSNKIGVAGVRQLVRRNISIPDMASVVLFDESEAFEFFPYPIPYLRQPLEDIGRSAVDVMLKRVNAEKNEQQAVQQLQLPVAWVATNEQ
ncbi:LacI family DNA-binding transcriptional regulator [Filimonas effusa]|uniref:LacI family transcriptional regulator n=1 Tax=Filimonas effusa TaxID=2508721 RepID=A0A4V1MAH7_9BACT|nr:LacI family DNA-binding transcriptional regulator [Filimonas effusa]RXK85916.1 LacI family transcriptional regulator [Filimonas effusa]